MKRKIDFYLFGFYNVDLHDNLIQKIIFYNFKTSGYERQICSTENIFA